MKISGDWISQAGTQALCAALTAAGYRALFVGGCVRNALMARAVADIDIATDALPEIVTNIAETAGFRVVPTGIEHGTVTVIAQGVAHEVTTFRRDIATDGRHATVAFATDIAQDAARRDFTMNALYAQADGSVIDPLGGLADLQARHLRFVGEASARIREDYLRILRFFRFYAIYGDPSQGIDAEGLAACAENLEGLADLSRERVGAEMRKLLAAADPAPAIASMAQAGVLAQILPGASPRALAPLVHLEAGLPPDWQARLAVIGGETLTEALRLSKAETVTIMRIRDEIGSTATPAALGWKFGAQVAQAVVLARAAVLEAPLPSGWQSEIARGAGAALPVTAADLMPALQGPDLGKRLREIEARWLASDLYLGKAALLA
ncbi:CCA tRNA nucleotidyltransferase [Cypionkella sp.]|uniref:CCA tRNA nucleotidyltransferase n=1 Tax=Cypionkella sp. TaxID=2811411 RepID=UPI002752A52D|nr:CCA tRNA nucleotidyltransferase [Cypionkella sp.]